MASTGGGQYSRIVQRIQWQGQQQFVSDANRLVRANERVEKSAKEAGAAARNQVRDVGALDQSLKTMGAFRWLSYAGFATVATGIGAITHEALGFEDAMAKVKAATGAEGPDFERMWRGTLDAAQTFRATGSEAADALYQITTGGVSAADSLEVLRSTLALAQAAEIDQGEAALLQIGIMNSFGKETEDLVDITDQLAQAARISGINLTDLAYTMKYLEGPANIANQSLEDVLEATALLGRLGMRGQNVGTGLASGLTNLATLTPAALETLGKYGKGAWFFQDTAGNLLGLQRIVEKVSELTAQMSSTERLNVLRDIFGKDSLDVWATLVNAQLENLDLVEQNREEFENFGGAAKDMAADMNTTVLGAFERLWGAITNISTAKGMEESSGIQDWLDDITMRIQNFDLNAWLQEHQETIDGLIATGGSLIAFGESLGEAFLAMHNALAPVIIPALEAFGAVLQLLSNPAMKPIIWALTAMYIQAKLAALAGAFSGSMFPGTPGGGPGRGGPTRGPLGGPPATGGGARGALSRGAMNAPLIGLIAGTAYEAGTAAGLDMNKSALENLGIQMNLSPGRDNQPAHRTIYGPRGTAPVRVVPPAPVQADRVNADDFVAPVSSRGRTTDLTRGNPEVHLHIDGREVATAVARHGEDLRARR